MTGELESLVRACSVDELPPGEAVQVPLDSNLRASSGPAIPTFYTADTVRALPISILPDPALPFAAGLPPDLTLSEWTVTDTVISGPCSVGNNQQSITSSVKLAYTDQNIWYGSLVLSKQGQGAYTTTVVRPTTVNGVANGGSVTDVYSFSIVNPTHITGTITLNWSIGNVCQEKLDMVLMANSSASPSPGAAE